jgi:hypothetical protein
MRQYILKEYAAAEPSSLKDASESKRKKDGILGVAQNVVISEVEECNRNGRVYRRPMFESALKAVMPIIEDNKLMGELDHPSTSDIERNATVLLKETSNLVTKPHWDGNLLRADVEFFDTPAGSIAYNIAKRTKIGLSSRGFGDLVKENTGTIVSEYEIVCWDTVSSPSVIKSEISLTESAPNLTNQSAAFDHARTIISESRRVPLNCDVSAILSAARNALK